MSLAIEYGNANAFRSSLYKNLTQNSEVFGQVRQAGKFSFVRVFNSGHEVTYYQPAISQEVWHRAIFGKDIATGTENTTEETGTTGNGTYESIPKSGMDPGPFLSAKGTLTVTATPPAITRPSAVITQGPIAEGVYSRPNIVWVSLAMVIIIVILQLT